MTLTDLMQIIRLATTGEVRTWLEQLLKENPAALAQLEKIILANPPVRHAKLPR